MNTPSPTRRRPLGWAPLIAATPLAVWMLSWGVGCERGAATKNPPTQPKPAAQQGVSTPGGYGAETPFDPVAVNGELFQDWPDPELVLVFSGGQHGYLEPCGCAGLENQKGGVSRRHTFLKSLAERGWETVVLDAGDQVRRRGRQALAKFGATRRALGAMNYDAAALGFGDFDALMPGSPDDLLLELIEPELEQRIVLSNCEIQDFADFEAVRPYLVVERAGRKIGVAAVLGEQNQRELGREADFAAPADVLPGVIESLEAAGCDHLVLLAQTSWDEALQLASDFPQFDFIAAPTHGEPRLDPQSSGESPTQVVDLGEKAMYLGVIGLFDDEETPVRYQRVPLDSRFPDSPEMKAIFAAYQTEIESIGFESLGVLPAMMHPDAEFGPPNGEFAGSTSCQECHAMAFGVWSGTHHALATKSLEDASPPRMHDPECLSCHATGWSPQDYRPFRTGFESLESTPRLVGNGCENCHGPGRAHVDAEAPGVDPETRNRLRQAMKLTVAEASAGLCQKCHDHDNSPEFDFETYWPKVKHAGKQ